MKIKELKALREKNVESLRKEANELKSKISKSRMEIKLSKEKNLKLVNNLTRDLSQILTIIREKEITQKSGNKDDGKGENKK